MVHPKLRYFLRPVASSGTIKNTASLNDADNLYPGYSASGQDVWLDYFDHEGDALIVSAVGARCGRTFLARGRWGTVANTQALLLEKSADQRFFWYVTNDSDFWERGGAAQPYVKVADTLRRRIKIPDLETQKAIADFLDRETARIDQLIEKKQRLVALLGERKQRIVDELSTKGLSTCGVSKRETEIDWLGEVPSHWTVEKLAWHFTAEKGRDA